MRALNRPAIQKTEDFGTHQIIHPRNVLKAKSAVLADVASVIDEAAIQRAEAALETLSPEFFGWMDQHVTLLTRARAALREDRHSEDARSDFAAAAHEIRGTGAAFGFPLATRVAESLCYILDKIGFDQAPVSLIDQHVDAIRAIVREDARGVHDRVGNELVQRLAVIANRYIETMEPRGVA
jgi:chemotaxis protein histidine kinase CheA